MVLQLPPLDLHAHVNPKTRPADLERLGAVVFAATRSLDEYESVRGRRDQVTVWGVGCHPGVMQAQQTFDIEKLDYLLTSTAFVSEIGLDGRSKTPLGEQSCVFASILSALRRTARIASIHSAGAAGRVLTALEYTPIKGAVLHWWRGDESQTRRAIELGCWFSINAAGVKYPNEVAMIPLERILTETDHPFGNRSSILPRQPGTVDDVERALSTIYNADALTIREQIWQNFVNLVDEVNVHELLPSAIQRMVDYATKKD